LNAREDILLKLRQAKHSVPEVESWAHHPHEEDLIAQFKLALESAKGEVITVKDLEKTWEVIGSLLSDLAAKQVAYNPEPPLKGQNLELYLPQYRWMEARGGEEELRRMCQAADVGITGAKFALAETGSIAIASGAQHSRLVSLLPPAHIVLLSEKVLVPDLISWEDLRPKRIPSQLVFISGPSKTADIEQTLVVGAHGPKRLIVIVYGEA
jgi:L-lactate dehydrogenase complex protein LldG